MIKVIAALLIALSIIVNNTPANQLLSVDSTGHLVNPIPSLTLNAALYESNLTITNTASNQPRLKFANAFANGYIGFSAGGYALYVNSVYAPLTIGNIYSDGFQILSDGNGNLTALTFNGTLRGNLDGAATNAVNALIMVASNNIAISGSASTAQQLVNGGNSVVLSPFLGQTIITITNASGSTATIVFVSGAVGDGGIIDEYGAFSLTKDQTLLSGGNFKVDAAGNAFGKIFTGSGAGLTNHLAFATNTLVQIYAHVTNGVATWTTSP